MLKIKVHLWQREWSNRSRQTRLVSLQNVAVAWKISISYEQEDQASQGSPQKGVIALVLSKVPIYLWQVSAYAKDADNDLLDLSLEALETLQVEEIGLFDQLLAYFPCLQYLFI